MDQSQEFGPTATRVFDISPVDESGDTTMLLSACDRETVDALSAESAFLIVQRGPNTGARFLLDAEAISADRSPKSDVFLGGVMVSRSRCQLIAVNGGHVMYDSGSLNGTCVNHERVDSARLNTGDEARIGKYCLTY